jgi:hypothetical protein
MLAAAHSEQDARPSVLQPDGTDADCGTNLPPTGTVDMKRTLRCAGLLLVAGCAAADGAGEWQGTRETLPNGAVRVTNSAQGVWRDDGGWRLVPELQIGVIEGAAPFMFSAIMGVEADDEGRIYVLDRQANELRIFGADGSHVRTVGRSGGGPGEYGNANGLRWLGPDSLLVIDQRGNRYSVLTRDGDYVRSVQRTLGFFGWAFGGGRRGDVVYEQTSVGAEGERRPVLIGTSLAGAADAPANGAADAADAGQAERAAAAPPAPARAMDTVPLPVTAAPAYESFSVRTERGGMVMGVPFAPGAVYRIDDDGMLWHGHGSEFRLFRSTFDGDTLLEIVLDAAPTPVTDAEIADWESGQGVAQFREMGGRLDLDRIPRTKPHFNDIHVAPDGHIWVSVPSAPRTAQFAIFAADGRYLGRLHLDGLTRDATVPLVVRNDRLYVVGRDELDVQRVYVYRIQR